MRWQVLRYGWGHISRPAQPLVYGLSGMGDNGDVDGEALDQTGDTGDVDEEALDQTGDTGSGDAAPEPAVEPEPGEPRYTRRYPRRPARRRRSRETDDGHRRRTGTDGPRSWLIREVITVGLISLTVLGITEFRETRRSQDSEEREDLRQVQAERLENLRFIRQISADPNFGDHRPLQYADLSGLNLGGLDMSNSDLSDADLFLTEFRRTDLSGAQMNRTLVDFADFGFADLTAATLTNLNSQDIRVDGLTSFIDLNNTKLNRAELSFSHIRVSGLQAYMNAMTVLNTTIEGNMTLSEMKYSVQFGAKYDGVDMKNVDLSNSILLNVDLSNVENLPSANLEGIIYGCTIQILDVNFLVDADGTMVGTEQETTQLKTNVLWPENFRPPPSKACPDHLWDNGFNIGDIRDEWAPDRGDTE